MSASWDKETDVLVVGSGAGGLIGALFAAHQRADVLIVEKAPEWGGSSAASGRDLDPVQRSGESGRPHG